MRILTCAVLAIAVTACAYASLPSRKACPGCESENTVYHYRDAQTDASWDDSAMDFNSLPSKKACPGSGHRLAPDYLQRNDCGYNESFRTNPVACPSCGSTSDTYYEYDCADCGATSQFPAGSRAFKYKLDFYYQQAILYLVTLMLYAGVRGTFEFDRLHRRPATASAQDARTCRHFGFHSP